VRFYARLVRKAAIEQDRHLSAITTLARLRLETRRDGSPPNVEEIWTHPLSIPVPQLFTNWSIGKRNPAGTATFPT
jgi:hypothetical protein